MIYERPARYRYAVASNGKRYPTWPVWYREDRPVKKHFRTLDCEDAYDSDDFFKVELRIASDPAYTEYINPNAMQRLMYARRAKVRAAAILANIETYKRNAAWRKRLARAKNEFDFVWEPYRQKLRKQYGWQWRWVIQEKRAKLYEEVWREMRRLAWVKQSEAYRAEWKQKYEAPPDLSKARAKWDARTTPEAWARVTLHEAIKGEESYGPRERAYDLQRIKEGMQWIDRFNNPYFTRIVVKIMDEQKDIRDQVDLINRIFNAAHEGRLQPLLEELNRRAGLYAA